jgi:hypothetical protein
MLAHTDLDDLRIWSVNEYRSSFGNIFVTSNILIAASNPIRYTSKSW